MAKNGETAHSKRQVQHSKIKQFRILPSFSFQGTLIQIISRLKIIIIVEMSTKV